MDLSCYIVSQVPPTIYYIPEFITLREEEHILNKVSTAPIPKWTQLLNRRLQNWGGIPHPAGMIAEKLPEWLAKYTEKIDELKVFDDGKISPNHVLVNEYLPGQGIMPHVDGPLFYPTITTISCGSHTILEFKPTSNQLEDTSSNKDSHISILLERRSLVIVKDIMYEKFLHSISEKTEDVLDPSVINADKTNLKIGEPIKRDTRISLTIRHVPKTSKIKLKLGR